jgi:cytochrome c oxidase cbb3-type subunit III
VARRSRQFLWFALVVATAATLALAQDAHKEPQSFPEFAKSFLERLQNSTAIPADAAAVEQGGKLYLVHCASCHGPGGEGGKGPTLATATLSQAQSDAELYRVIREGVSGTEMPRARLERAEVGQVAAFVKSLGNKPPEQVPGDSVRGANLYATKGQCATCHTVNGRGGAYGPDLSDVGRRRSAAHLRLSVTDPNAEVPQSFNAFRSDPMLPNNFLYVRAVTRDGTHIDGIRVNEDTFSILIRDGTGKVHALFKADLRQLHKDWGKSPMPSYKDAFTPAELDDLVAYMVSLRAERKKDEKKSE